MRQAGVLFDLQYGLLDALDVSDFVDAQLLEVASLQGEQLGAADVVPDEIVAVFFQLERFQPDGYFVRAPQMDVEAQVDGCVCRTAAAAAAAGADATLGRSHFGMAMSLAGGTRARFRTAEFETE